MAWGFGCIWNPLSAVQSGRYHSNSICIFADQGARSALAGDHYRIDEN